MTPDAGVSLRITADRDLVAGFPQWIALRLYNESTSATYSRQRPVSFVSTPRALNLTATRGDTVVASVDAIDPADVHGAWFMRALGPGKERTFLIDLDTVMSLGPGAYRLFVEYTDAHASATSTLRLDEPEDGEAKVIQRLEDGPWRARILEHRTGVPLGPNAPSLRAHQHLRLYGALQACLWSEGWGTDPTIFDRFDGVLEGPAAALRYELAKLSGTQIPGESRAMTATRWPGLDWWLDTADDGCGAIASLRRLRH